ncbi:PocR ligand-binding domain-containing protein, partial [Myxococcota bacterium]|nr:PocR ligand-binding domain-containing protein [Myxococcota bacterium]
MKLSDVIELNELQQLCGSFTAMTGAATSFIDLDGKDLVASGNQNMCTLFHRENPRCALYCATARADLADRLRQGERYVVNQCPNGLFELAIPLVVGGQPVAIILVGPFLQAPPDVASFDRQAEEFGFDRSSYLASAKALPVFSEEKTETIADFLIQGARIIGELGTTGMLLEERKAHIRFLENLELIDWTIKQETDIEKMLWHIVKTVFSIFGCDRAWLFYPCDP